MRQRFINIHHLRAEVFKLKPLQLPECLTRQARGHFPGIDGQRLSVA